MGEQLSSVFERIKMCHLLFCDFKLLSGLQLKAHGHPQNGAVGRTCGGIKSSAGPIRPKTEEVRPKQEPHGLEEERFYSREVGTKKRLPTWERSKESNHSNKCQTRFSTRIRRIRKKLKPYAKPFLKLWPQYSVVNPNQAGIGLKMKVGPFSFKVI